MGCAVEGRSHVGRPKVKGNGTFYQKKSLLRAFTLVELASRMDWTKNEHKPVVRES